MALRLNKVTYYIKGYSSLIIPNFIFRWQLNSILKRNDKNLEFRINYYNKLNTQTALSDSAISIKELNKEDGTTYYLDTLKYLRYFTSKYRFDYVFKDVTHIPDTPSFVKSRPISDRNANSVLLKLNRIRHFNFVKDHKAFNDKKDTLVWRGNVLENQVSRQIFLHQHFNNPKFDAGHVNDYDQNQYKVAKLSIEEQLNYKFILSLEGNDVATNLKWIMSSNSLCMMPKPRYETWFMEGTLKAGKHYVEIKDDFSDLDEKVQYYTKHPDEALLIIKQANAYCQQFKNKKQELFISLMVVKKYLEHTNP